MRLNEYGLIIALFIVIFTSIVAWCKTVKLEKRIEDLREEVALLKTRILFK